MKKNSVKSNLLRVFVLLLLMTGCGLKANPEPQASSSLPAQNLPILTARVAETSVELSWRLENPDGRINHLNIEKSAPGEKDRVCRNCPQAFEKLAGLTLSGAKQDYSFLDSSVEKGKTYSYRLMLCDQAGVCRASQKVDIDIH